MQYGVDVFHGTKRAENSPLGVGPMAMRVYTSPQDARVSGGQGTPSPRGGAAGRLCSARRPTLLAFLSIPPAAYRDACRSRQCARAHASGGQSPQRSADRSTRRPKATVPRRASSVPGCPRLGRGARPHPEHGGAPPIPPEAVASLLVVASRPRGSVPGQHATRPRLPPAVDQGGTSRSGPRRSACGWPSAFFAPSVNARHDTAGRALQCQGQALRVARKRRARQP
jgi:hypothetical protein